MQTFLPYPDFRESAKALDNKRLGKQRVEAYQLLITLLEKRGAWINHPAARMWRGYESALALYALEVCDEWKNRGCRDTCHDKILELVNRHGLSLKKVKNPPWLGNPEFHASHRSNLLRKAATGFVKANALWKNYKAYGLHQKEKTIHRRFQEAKAVYEWYDQFKWEESYGLPYIWPVH